MYYQINPTEMFRERQLALLQEAENRRLARRLRAGREPKLRRRTAVILGFLMALVVAGLMLVGFSSPAHASTTFTVDFDGDQGDINLGDGVCDVDFGDDTEVCTLRAAIQEANRAPGADIITFNISSLDGFATISPTEPLPSITDPVTIDGYTQPGASPNTLAQGTNAVLKIELNGINAGFAEGLVISAGGSGSVVKGLAINRFASNGVQTLPFSTQNRIEGNFIGTDLSGTFDLGNSQSGVSIADSPNRITKNTVGGTSPAARNLISGNGGDGVFIFSGTNNRVEGNLIGTKKDGTTALGSSSKGVNIISSSNNTVSSNTIAFNGKDGVGVSGNTGNLLVGNSIFSNAEEGIDLGGDGPTANDLGDQDTGPNELQNKPLITSARTSRKGTTIASKLNSTPSKTFLVQFFSNASGDEGQKVIGQAGVTTDGSGNASFTFKPAQKVGKGKITATATETASRNTSEFSAAKKVVRKRR